jgi:hypothetical protein
VTTYRRKAHTRVVNGKSVHVRASKVNGPDPRVAWLDALFSKRDRDDDDFEDEPEASWPISFDDQSAALYAADRGEVPRIVTLTENYEGGWKAGDLLCQAHATGYNPGCPTCRVVASGSCGSCRR